jgi:hypothetical protein
VIIGQEIALSEEVKEKNQQACIKQGKNNDFLGKRISSLFNAELTDEFERKNQSPHVK